MPLLPAAVVLMAAGLDVSKKWPFRVAGGMAALVLVLKIVAAPVFDGKFTARELSRHVPADACADCLANTHWQTRLPGGRGAVREAIERLMRARSLWEEFVSA